MLKSYIAFDVETTGLNPQIMLPNVSWNLSAQRRGFLIQSPI